MLGSLKIKHLNTLFVVLFTALITIVSYAQSNDYSESNTTNIDGNKRFLKFTDSITNQVIEQRHYKSGQIKSENYFVSNTVKRFHGKQTYWNENGIINSEIYYKNGKKTDRLLLIGKVDN